MKRMLTILVVPNRTSSVRRFRISSRTMWILASCLLIVIGLVVAASMHYGAVIDQLAEGITLERKNQKLASRLNVLQNKLLSIEPVVDRLLRSEDKLRAVSLRTGKERRLAVGPYGDKTDESGGDNLSGHVLPFIRTMGTDPDLAVKLLVARLDDLAFSARLSENSILQIETKLQGQDSRLASTPTIWPCPGWVTSDFGLRTDPYTGLPTMHRGIDIANKPGVPVIAPANAIVVSTALHGKFGKLLELDHGLGIRTRFGHLQEIRVRVGDRVQRGDTIAELGNSGRSTGPHLHYEVKVNGIHENPRSYLLDDQ